jgi:hypothetical protein
MLICAAVTVYGDRIEWVIIQLIRFSAKFWLDPVSMAQNLGFNPRELLQIEKLVAEHRADFLEAWHEHFGG